MRPTHDFPYDSWKSTQLITHRAYYFQFARSWIDEDEVEGDLCQKLFKAHCKKGTAASSYCASLGMPLALFSRISQLCLCPTVNNNTNTNSGRMPIGACNTWPMQAHSWLPVTGSSGSPRFPSLSTVRTAMSSSSSRPSSRTSAYSWLGLLILTVVSMHTRGAMGVFLAWALILTVFVSGSCAMCQPGAKARTAPSRDARYSQICYGHAHRCVVCNGVARFTSLGRDRLRAVRDGADAELPRTAGPYHVDQECMTHPWLDFHRVSPTPHSMPPHTRGDRGACMHAVLRRTCLLGGGSGSGW